MPQKKLIETAYSDFILFPQGPNKTVASAAMTRQRSSTMQPSLDWSMADQDLLEHLFKIDLANELEAYCIPTGVFKGWSAKYCPQLTPVMILFPHFLRWLRVRALKMTIKDLAIELNYPRKLVSEWQSSCYHYPPIDLLPKIWDLWVQKRPSYRRPRLKVVKNSDYLD